MFFGGGGGTAHYSNEAALPSLAESYLSAASSGGNSPGEVEVEWRFWNALTEKEVLAQRASHQPAGCYTRSLGFGNDTKSSNNMAGNFCEE